MLLVVLAVCQRAEKPLPVIVAVEDGLPA